MHDTPPADLDVCRSYGISGLSYYTICGFEGLPAQLGLCMSMNVTYAKTETPPDCIFPEWLTHPAGFSQATLQNAAEFANNCVPNGGDMAGIHFWSSGVRGVTIDPAFERVDLDLFSGCSHRCRANLGKVSQASNTSYLPGLCYSYHVAVLERSDGGSGFKQN